MLQGTGWMEITFIFYGYYQPALLQWREYYYDIGVGYQLTIFWVLILSLFCMANSVAQVRGAGCSCIISEIMQNFVGLQRKY